MYIRVRPFRAGDIKKFKPIEPIETDLLIDDEISKAIEKSGLAVTGIVDGKVFCCGGVHPINETQGEIWIRLSKKCLRIPVSTMRWLWAGMKIIEEDYPFNQLFASINKDFKTGIKMAERFGFVPVRLVKNRIIYSKRVKD